MPEHLAATLREAIVDGVPLVSLTIQNTGPVSIPRGWGYEVFRVLDSNAEPVGTLVGEQDLEAGASAHASFETGGVGSGYLVAQVAQYIDDVEYVGRLTYDTPKKAARARRDAIKRGPVAQLVRVPAPDVLEVVGRGPALAPGTELEAALTLLARRARRGSVSCNMFGREVGLRIEAGSKRWREVVPDRGLAGDATNVVEGVRHVAPIGAFVLNGTQIAAAGGRTGYRGSGADVSVWKRETGELVARAVGLRDHVAALALNAQGTRLAGADKSKAIVWGMPYGDKVATVRVREARTLAFDGERLSLGTKHGAFVAEGPEWQPVVVREEKDRVDVYAAAGGFFSVGQAGCAFHPDGGVARPLAMPDARWGPPDAAVTPDGSGLVHTWGNDSGPATSVWSREGRRKATFKGWGRLVALDDEHILLVQDSAPHVVWKWRSSELAHLDLDLPKARLRRISATELATPDRERLRLVQLPPTESLDFVKADGSPQPKKEPLKAPSPTRPGEPRPDDTAPADPEPTLSRRALTWAAWVLRTADLQRAAEARPPKTKWTWDRQPNGTHRGASLGSGAILWYVDSPNPHGASTGSHQSLEEFMAEGWNGGGKIGDEIMVEIYVAVRRQLASG